MSSKTEPKAFKGKGSTPSIKNIKTGSKYKSNGNDSGIPKEIANRMARRIAITTGIPTISGMSVFIVSYLLVSKGIAEIAPAVTLLTSAACFLLGLVGLSYGILSTSWDEQKGSFLGFENIPTNLKRVNDAFKSLSLSKEKNKIT
tara:strand:+ start:5599 stop:6033 length:435 start_codon:yes stop_codon:yes gene_type:complete